MASRNYGTGYSLPLAFSSEWHGLRGMVPVRITNDYLFRALMQSDNETMASLIAALLHMDRKEIVSAEITNPILLGDSIADKYYILDIKVLLNGNINLNLEMQVIKEADWIERSLGYLCRTYDSLNRGQAYVDAHPAIQIGLLDFTLFPDNPEFYAVYKLMNVRSGRVYTEKFRLCGVDLTNTDLATEEDRAYGIDEWARMFKAKTWEELAMVAQKNPAIDRAVSGIYQLTEDEIIQEQCRQREEFYLRQEMEKQRLERMRNQLTETEYKLTDTKSKLTEAEDKLVETEGKLTETEGKLTETEGKLTETEGKLTETEGKLTDTESKLTDTESKLTDTENKLTDTEKDLRSALDEINRLKAWLGELRDV